MHGSLVHPHGAETDRPTGPVLVNRTRLGEREFELAPSDCANVSTPWQPMMALFDEHQLGISNFAGSAGGMVDEGKGVVVALGDKRWHSHLGKGERVKVDFVRFIVPLARLSESPRCEGGGEFSYAVESCRIGRDPFHRISFAVLTQAS